MVFLVFIVTMLAWMLRRLKKEQGRVLKSMRGIIGEGEGEGDSDGEE